MGPINIMENFNKIILIFLLVLPFGCAIRNNQIELFSGEWDVENYSITPISAWSDDQAKALLGGKMKINNNRIDFYYSGKTCGLNILKPNIIESHMNELIFFNNNSKGHFEATNWGVDKEQKVIELDLHSIVCPFYYLIFLEKDKKMVGVGEGGAFLLSQVHK